VVAFARFVVITNQPFAILAIVVAVFVAMWPINGRLWQLPNDILKDCVIGVTHFEVA
jgi:hypothetical protein